MPSGHPDRLSFGLQAEFRGLEGMGLGHGIFGAVQAVQDQLPAVRYVHLIPMPVRHRHKQPMKVRRRIELSHYSFSPKSLPKVILPSCSITETVFS